MTNKTAMNEFHTIMKDITKAHRNKKPVEPYQSKLMDWFDAKFEVTHDDLDNMSIAISREEALDKKDKCYMRRCDIMERDINREKYEEMADKAIKARCPKLAKKALKFKQTLG